MLAMQPFHFVSKLKADEAVRLDPHSSLGKPTRNACLPLLLAANSSNRVAWSTVNVFTEHDCSLYQTDRARSLLLIRYPPFR